MSKRLPMRCHPVANVDARTQARPFACVVLGLMLMTPSVAPADEGDQSQWKTADMVDLLPTTANAVSIVRVEQILASPRAQAADYAEKYQRLYEQGEAVIPPWVRSSAIAALFRPSQSGPAFRAIVAELAKDAPVTTLDGQAQMLFGKVPVLATERDAIFAGRPGGRVVGWSPASRSELGHWLKGSFKQGLSEALSRAVDSPASEVILAMELTDLVREQSARERFASDPAFDGQVDEAVDLVTAVESISCRVDVSSELECQVVITSRDSARMFSSDDAQLGKMIFLAVLGDTGYGLPEFSDFAAAAAGRQLTLTGRLHDDSLGALMSLGVPPLASGSSSLVKATPATTSPEPSRRHNSVRVDPLEEFERIETMLDVLERRQKRATSPSSVASWCDTTASRLDSMSTGTSSKTVSSFAARTATRLRAIGSSLRGLSTGLNAEQNTLTYNVKRDPGWASVNVWGGVGWRNPSVQVDSNLREVRRRQAELVKQSAGERESLWGMIQEDRASTKRQLLGVDN